ncbi:MAG: N-acetylmuramoyl-L-alanine amidase, partial [Actinomycetota bacterium]|nr:N-acetylmuramoyl-L-alanine amidase [Actinomycetota bacterium]
MEQEGASLSYGARARGYNTALESRAVGHPKTRGLRGLLSRGGPPGPYASLRLLLGLVLALVFPVLAPAAGLAAVEVAPTVAIASPADGLATNKSSVDVAVRFAAGANPAAGGPTGNVSLLTLELNGEEVGRHENPPRVKEDTHVFAVDLSSRPEGEARLVAFAYQGDPKAGLVGRSGAVSVAVDRTPPEVKAVTTPSANANGWNRSDVTVSFEATDALSGVAEVSPDVAVTQEGEGQVVTGTAKDRAGNTASISATINLDKTPPAVKAEVVPAANENGWHKEDATVRFSATDALSGVEDVSPERTVAAKGEEQPVEGTATDMAGNTASASARVSLDKTAPEISALSPAEGAVLDHARPTLSAAFSDALSGVDPSTARVLLDGAPARGELSATPEGLSFVPEADLPEGHHTVAVGVGDRAGNLAEKASGFEVDLGPPPGGPALRVVPSRLRVDDVGSTARLGAFLEENGATTDVSKDPATLYRSSAPSVVSVDAAGEMTFLAEGSAEVTATHGGLRATSLVEVDAQARPLIEGEIGPAGGEVVLPNGTGVVVPEGALGGRETIRIEEQPAPPGTVLPEGIAPAAPVYEFGPDGLAFQKPVEVRMSYDPAGIPPGHVEGSILGYLLNPDNGRWEVESGLSGAEPAEEEEEDHQDLLQSVDLGADLVGVTTDHFSKRRLAVAGGLDPTTLAADDGTELQVFRHIKTEKPGKGPDNRWGAAPFPNVVDSFERGAGNDDAALNIDQRPVPTGGDVEDNIQNVVLHSTAGGPGHTFEGEVTWAQSRRNLYTAHYFVDKDGTIAQIADDDRVLNHTRTNNTLGVSNDNAIGIEIFNNCARDAAEVPNDICDPDEPYPGAQVAGVVRLVDFLLREHPNIARPGAADPNGDLFTHHAVDAANKRDPFGNFRGIHLFQTAPDLSLESIISRTLREEHGGLIEAKGGDALGVNDAGAGGKVDFVFGDSGLEASPADATDSLVVPAGTERTLTGTTDLMHLIVDGTLRIDADADLDVDGVFYVGPNGKIDASGTATSVDGHSVNVEADGFALIEGTVDLSGEDGASPGRGGSAGDFSFKTAAPGPAWVPTIVSRGGDADESLPDQLKAGGNGGSVMIQALENNTPDPVNVQFRGGAAPADTLPPPPPFTQMPIVTAGSFGQVRPAPADCRRPASGERLPLGRLGGAPDGENISSFERGILTVGGIGGGHDDRIKPQAPGGDAGS